MECTNLLCGNYVLTIHPNVQPIENFNEINVFHFALKKDASIQTHSSKINVLRLLKSLVANHVHPIV